MKKNTTISVKSSFTDIKKSTSLIFVISVLLIWTGCFYYEPAYASGTSSSDDVTITLLSGEEHIYHQGFGDSNQTVVTDTPWALDKISVSGDQDTRTVLDQFVNADDLQTKITRNALFIGSGSIDTKSIYKGSNVPDGEDNRTGILITGENYGVLIGNCCSIFDENFGGIKDSIATASGNYLIQLVGDLGKFSDSDFTIGKTETLLKVTGKNSATLETLLYGTFPQYGTDFFYQSTKGCATGTGSFFYSGTNHNSSIKKLFEIFDGWGEMSAEFIFEHLELYSQFKFEDYGQFTNIP